MIEDTLTLEIPPGFAGNGGMFQNRNRWVSGTFVRFRNGTAQPIGGWTKLQDSAGADVDVVNGCPMAMVAFHHSDGKIRMVVGTNTKLYAIVEGVVSDITPASFVTGSCSGSIYDGSGNYGDGDYGDGPYGGNLFGSSLVDADSWQLDQFGDYVVACFSADGRILIWDGDPNNVATEIDASAPEDNRAVVVTPESFVVAIGASGSARTIQWASQASGSVWTPTEENTAGDLPVASRGRLLAGRRVRRGTLIFSELDVWLLGYVGGPAVYGLDQVGADCGLIGPNAVATSGSLAFWMSTNGFWMFDGMSARVLLCEVADVVFADINMIQRHRFHAQSNAEFDEITWYYCSATATDNDRYVTYNHKEGHWVTGALPRATGVDAGPTERPLMIDHSGQIWVHEYGFDHSQGAGGANAFISSGPIVLGDGSRRMRVQRVIPDEFAGGLDLTLQILTRNYPTDAFNAAVTVQMAGTKPRNVRTTGREIWLTYYESFGSGKDWRLGHPRLGVLPDGKR